MGEGRRIKLWGDFGITGEGVGGYVEWKRAWLQMQGIFEDWIYILPRSIFPVLHFLPI